jgi:membrane protease YdiL (CAAX protease family)
VVVILGAYNAVVNELLDPTYQGVVALLAAVALLGAAHAAGLTHSELGLSRSTVGAGVRYGACVAAVVAVAVSLVAWFPSTRDNFLDAEFLDMSVATLLWETLVRIPTVTAGFEELAFRGVLLASLTGPIGRNRAIVVQALLFGIWHILPTMDAATPLVEIVVAVSFTALAGVLFGVLATKSRSLVAPFIVHTVTNGTTFTAAWMVTNHLSS